MATDRASRYLRQGNGTHGLKAAVLVIGISALSYLGVEIARQAGPLLSAASGYALESRMLNPEVIVEPQGAQSVEGNAMAANLRSLAPIVSVRDFEYFPDHYANEATTVENQPPTF